MLRVITLIFFIPGGGVLIGSSDPYQDAEEELSAYLGWLAEIDGNGDAFDVVRHGSGVIGDSVNNVDGSSRGGGSLGQMQGIFELDADCNVILQGRIGQGFYGEVYRGTLERDNAKDAEPQQVAVKKLKTRALEADLRDFEREISIMKVMRTVFNTKFTSQQSSPVKSWTLKIFLTNLTGIIGAN